MISGTSGNTVFECVVVDQFSKGSFWMVTDCTEDWKEDEIKRKCRAVGLRMLNLLIASTPN